MRLIRSRRLIAAVLSLCAVLACSRSAIAQTPLGSGFTYQGQLKRAGAAYSGNADFEFKLFPASAGGTQVGVTQGALNVTVTSGLFTVPLNFGTAAFEGSERWLEVSVRTPAGNPDPYTTLTPRQLLTATPYALRALNASVSGTQSSAVTFTNPTNTFTGNGAGLTGLNPTSLSGGTAGISITGNAATASTAGNVSGIVGVANGGTGASSAAAALANLGGVDAVTAGVGLTGGGTSGTVSLEVADQLALGSGTPPLAIGLLELHNGAQAQPTIRLEGVNSRISTFGSDGLEQVRLWGPTWGELYLHDSGVGNERTVLLSANSNAGGSLSLYDTNAAQRVLLSNTATGGQLSLWDETGVLGVRLGSVTAGGSVQMYQSNGITLGMSMEADDTGTGGGGLLVVHKADGNDGIVIDGNSVGNSGQISILDTDGTEAVEILAAETSTTGGQIVLRNAAGATQIELDAEFGVAGDPGRIIAPQLQLTDRVVGNLGIGRTPTTNAIEVEGNASKSAAGSWLANSDARIKADVQTIESALDTLDRVRLVSFRYAPDYLKSHPTIENRRYLNVIAQEFAQVFPDEVQRSGERLATGEDILQVDTYPLTIYSAAAIQELHEQVRTQQDEIETLRGDIARLHSMIEQLARKREP